MAKELQLRQESGWMVVSSTPDVCRTPIGSSVVPVPYMIVAQLINAVKVSKNVRANGNPVVLHQRKKDKIYMNSHSDSKGNTFGKVS